MEIRIGSGVGNLYVRVLAPDDGPFDLHGFRQHIGLDHQRPRPGRDTVNAEFHQTECKPQAHLRLQKVHDVFHSVTDAVADYQEQKPAIAQASGESIIIGRFVRFVETVR